VAKIIDADALVEELTAKLVGTRSSELGINLRNIINSQPDASEPLRKRVMELEARIKELEDALKIGLRAAKSRACVASYDDDHEAEELWDAGAKIIESALDKAQGVGE